MRYLRRPSPAFVVSVAALAMATTGSAYAVATGSIDSREIKNNTIRTQDIRTGHVRNSDLGGNSVSTSKVRPDALTGADINEGSLGQVPSANAAANANAVNGRTAASLDTAGNSNQNGAVIALPAVDTLVAQTSITTTRAGFVLASGSAELSGNGATTGTCLISIDGVNSLAYEVNPDDVGPPLGNNQAVSSVNFGRSLPAGVHTAQLLCRSVDGVVTKDDAAINLVGVGS